MQKPCQFCCHKPDNHMSSAGILPQDFTSIIICRADGFSVSLRHNIFSFRQS